MPVKEKPDTSQTMSFWEHLDVMRGYLLRMAVVILALFLVVFCFKGLLFDVVLAPRDDGFITYRLINRVAASLGLEPMPPFSVELINTGLAGQFVAHMKVAFYAALLCASPFVLYMAFRFVSPALYARERHYALRVMPGAFVMFMVGLLLGYFVIFPLIFRFLGTYHVSGEVSPIMGSAAQAEAMAGDIIGGFESDPQSVWEANFFGRSLRDVVQDGLAGKVGGINEDTRVKLRKAMTRMVNEGKGGVICILL